MEAIRISCAGYPTRRTFDEFIDRFGLLAPEVLDGRWFIIYFVHVPFKCDVHNILISIYSEVSISQYFYILAVLSWQL